MTLGRSSVRYWYDPGLSLSEGLGASLAPSSQSRKSGSSVLGFRAKNPSSYHITPSVKGDLLELTSDVKTWSFSVKTLVPSWKKITLKGKPRPTASRRAALNEEPKEPRMPSSWRFRKKSVMVGVMSPAAMMMI